MSDIKDQAVKAGKDWIAKPENQATVKKYALKAWTWLKSKIARKN